MSGDNIKVSVQNIRQIAKIKSELDSIFLTKPYLKKVEDFVKAFDLVQELQDNYFASLNIGFTPKTVFEEVKQANVDITIESLTEAGIGAAYTDTIKEILLTNITSGGSYSDMIQTLRDAIIGKEGEDGTLVRYAKQITTDAINQYSANYNMAVSNDLGLVWYQYTGSLLTTSRAFCKALVAKRYFHISEVPELLQGHVGDKNVPINSKTDLPFGMNEATNKQTFFTYRGGYNCAHQIFAVITEGVPQEIRNKFAEA